jgi:hypothetical protein
MNGMTEEEDEIGDSHEKDTRKENVLDGSRAMKHEDQRGWDV